MEDREDVVRQVARSFDVAAARLKERGCSELEIGKGLVSAGLAMWGRAAGIEDMTLNLAKTTTALLGEINSKLDRQRQECGPAH